jgi:uncharacterized protein (TIGR02118 family)
MPEIVHRRIKRRRYKVIKLVYIVRRRPDISPEQFRKYWLEQHGPLVRTFAKTIRACRYVQSHTLDTEVNVQLARSRGMGEAFDGITEVWWDSLNDLIAALGSREGQAANRTLIEDESKFVDLPRSSIFVTEEHTIFDD